MNTAILPSSKNCAEILLRSRQKQKHKTEIRFFPRSRLVTRSPAFFYAYGKIRFAQPP
jgi:hypothetical protein